MAEHESLEQRLARLADELARLRLETADLIREARELRIETLKKYESESVMPPTVKPPDPRG